MAVTIYQTDGTFFVQFPGQSPVGRTGGSLTKYRYAAGEWFQILFNGDVLFNEFWSDITIQGEFPALDPNQKSDQIDDVISDYTAAGGSGGTGPGTDTAEPRGWADQFTDLDSLDNPEEGQTANVDTIQYRYTGGSWQSTGVTVLKQFPARPVREQPFKDIQGSFTTNGDTLEADSNDSLLHIANFSNEGDYVEFNLATTPAITQSIYIGYWQGSGAVDTASNWFAAVELRIVSGGTEYRLRNHNNTSGGTIVVPFSTPIRLVISQGSWQAVVGGTPRRFANDGLATIPTKVLSIGVAGSGDRIPLNYTFSS